MKQYIFLSFLSMILTTACSTILVNTTNREGIQENPTRRTPGAIVEDQSIETIVAVNLKADNLAFRETRFNVISHNGIVLLVGQIQAITDLLAENGWQFIASSQQENWALIHLCKA